MQLLKGGTFCITLKRGKKRKKKKISPCYSFHLFRHGRRSFHDISNKNDICLSKTEGIKLWSPFLRHILLSA